MLARAATLAALLLAASRPAAAGVDCVDEIAAASQRYQMPAALLYAVAVSESGIPCHDTAKGRPAPIWCGAGVRPNAFAVNVEGESHQFNSAEAAIAFVTEQQRHGHRSIDIGCLQVNLHHHPNAFPSIEEGFQPGRNVDYGAHYLHDLYVRFGNWTSATAFYHSGTPAEQWKYVCTIHARLVQYGLAQPSRCEQLRKALGDKSFRPDTAPLKH